MGPKFFDGCAAALLAYAAALWSLFELPVAVLLTATSIAILVVCVGGYLLLECVFGRVISSRHWRNPGREATLSRGRSGSGFWSGVSITFGIATAVVLLVVTPGRVR